MVLDIPDAEMWFLVMVRMLAALAPAPIFGHRSVPTVAKVGLAAGLAWLLVMPGGTKVARPEGWEPFLLALVAEMGLGLLLGFAVSLAFWAVTMAGDLVALQMGFGFAGTLHSSLEQSSSALSQFYTLAATLVFLTIGGHRMFLSALANTLAIAPPYSFIVGDLHLHRVIELASTIFAAAFQIALPVLGTLLLVDATLALLSRVLPQLNAFIFGLPLKIAAGLLALWISLPALLSLTSRWVSAAPLNIQAIVK
jgi:flagellar biosynthetic protein FliR